MIYNTEAEFFGLTSSMIRLGSETVSCNTYQPGGLIFGLRGLYPGIGIGRELGVSDETLRPLLVYLLASLKELIDEN